MDKWIEEMEAELEKMTHAYRKKIHKEPRGDIARQLSETFLKIWIRFAVDLGREDMRLTPWQWDVSSYRGKKEFIMKEDFNFDDVGEVILEYKKDRYQALRADFYVWKKHTHLRVYFELESSRSGSALTTRRWLVYDAPLKDANLNEMWEKMKDGVLAWYGSLSTGDDGPLWDFVASHYPEIKDGER